MKTNMVGAINNALDLAMAENPDVVLLGEDIGKDGGVFRATDGLQAKYGEGRVMDTPLAESVILGSSIGMAMAGLHPVAEIQFAGFMFMGFGQLINHAARYRSRTRSSRTVPMVVRTPVSGGVRTLEHHSESPEAYYSHIGGLIVVEPATPYDAKGLLIKALHMNDPVVFLEPTKLYRLFKQEIPDEMYEVEIGKANVVGEGSDISIITYGTMHYRVLLCKYPHLAAYRCGNVNNSLVSLYLEERLVLLYRIAVLDKPFLEVALGDTFPDINKPYLLQINHSDIILSIAFDILSALGM